MGSQRKALEAIGLSRSTWQYRHRPRPRVEDPVPHRDRAQPSRLSGADRDQIARRIQDGWAQGLSVDSSFARAWDDGVMLGSRRTWWRIAGQVPDQSVRPAIPTRKDAGARSPRVAPVVVASAPMDAWSWDITDLRSPWRGVCFKAYSILDIFSRKVVGWRVEEREADDLAVDMFQRAFGIEGIPGAVHSDSGPSMRSGVLRDLLGDLGVTQTFNRPRVSNDNPYSESEFKTMKYRPGYPGTFDTLEQARDYMAWYVDWYNSGHKHSGIALFSPDEVHDGTWHQAWVKRDQVLADYYDKHPERFRARPVTPAPPGIVGINIPEETSIPTAA